MTIGLTPFSSQQEVIDSLNYITATGAAGLNAAQVATYIANDPTIGNITSDIDYISNTAVFVYPSTGHIAAVVAGNVIGYIYRNIHFAYATAADGSTGFSTTVYTNKTYYGIRNTNETSESTNATDYVWYEVADGGFGTTKSLWYITIGANNISILVATSAPNAFYRATELVSYVDLYQASVIYIPDSYITAQQILDATISNAKIALNAIDASLIANETITGNLIALNTITGNLVATNTIYGNSIVAGSITATELEAGLLSVGNIISFGANIGDLTSSGYWLEYTTGDVRFAGNTNIGGNVNIEGLITAGDIIAGAIDTTALAFNAASQQVLAYYQPTNILTNAQGTAYYKMPKLVNWRSGLSSANEMAVILSANIVPSSSNSTIIVDFSAWYDNDTNSDLGAVALYRSNHEGSSAYLYAGNQYTPWMPYNFRKIDVCWYDEQSQGDDTDTRFVVSGYENLSGAAANFYGSPSTRSSYSNATITTFSINKTTGAISETVKTSNTFPISGIASWAVDESVVHRKAETPILGYQYLNIAYFSFPNTGLPYSDNITAMLKTPFADSGQTNAHGALIATRTNSNPLLGNAIIYQSAEISGNVYTANELEVEGAKFNAIGCDQPPWVGDDFYNNIVAVGDNAAIWTNSSRVYGADGVLDSQNGWYQADVWTGGDQQEQYSGNLYGVAYSGQGNNWQSRSNFVAGNGADAGHYSNAWWVVCGEKGGIFQRYTYVSNSNLYFQPVSKTPNQYQQTTFRAITWDAYRNRFWAVGDGGAIVWGFITLNDTIIFNTYNSGTTRNLYDIKYDPMSAKWTAVGDGIIIVDDGQTIINGQRSYPSGTAYAFDAMAGEYTSYAYPVAKGSYEPTPVVSYKGFSAQDSHIFNGFIEHNSSGVYQFATGDATELHRGSVVSGKYVENTDQQQIVASHGHYEGVPITFYLMAGAPSGSNVIVGSPTLTITEYKR